VLEDSDDMIEVVRDLLGVLHGAERAIENVMPAIGDVRLFIGT
jgi:hypothetical protein